MKKSYIQPAIDTMLMEPEQMIANSISIANTDATTTDDIYDDSRTIESMLGLSGVPGIDF